MSNRRYGWKRDPRDERDHKFKIGHIGALPAKVDLRPQMPAVYDQMTLGSCSSQAIAGAYEYELMRQKHPTIFTPSRLFIYFNERAIENSINEDSGACLRDGIKTIARDGACPETLWPYDISQFTVKPPQQCYAEALKEKVLQYESVQQDLQHIKAALAQGLPVIFGFQVYTSFESDWVKRTGELDMPTNDEENLGGHAVLCVGYDDGTQRVMVRNSWGKDWGLDGYFTMPYNYISDPSYASDFWAIQLIQ